MQFVVDVRAAGVLQALGGGEKKARFAIANAMNGTTKAIQAAERAEVLKDFTVRPTTRQFLLRQAAVIKGATGGSGFASATQGRFETRIAVGQPRRLLLAQFEKGGARPPAKGRRAGVPVIGGPTFRQLKMHRRPRGKVGGKRRRRLPKSQKPQLIGAQRTFRISSSARQPEGGIYQRTGKGPGAIRLVHAFVLGEQLPRRLRFISTAHRVATHEFPRRLRREVGASFRHGALKITRGLGL